MAHFKAAMRMNHELLESRAFPEISISEEMDNCTSFLILVSHAGSGLWHELIKKYVPFYSHLLREMIF